MMETVNNTILLIVVGVVLVHLGPFIKGFYDGFKDSQDGKPHKDIDNKN